MANTVETDWASSTATHRVIYRIDTGQIVAIETVWAEEGVGFDQPEALYRRLESIKQGFTAQAGPLDVLNVHALPGGAMRVDLATRTLIALERRITDELAEPPALSHP